MKIYLDIDGTILKNEYLQSDNGYTLTSTPAKHLKNFLECILENHDVYWLSTHCRGVVGNPRRYLTGKFDENLLSLVDKVKPAKWVSEKYEVFNFDEEFLWFDDKPSEDDILMLEKHNKLHCLIKVDLDNDPDIFLNFMDI